jgi:hypothetical protein
MARWLLLALIIGATPVFGAAATAQPQARTVLALYDSLTEQSVRFSRIHRYAELPLNHLGLRVRYWDVQQGLPDAASLRGVRGIILWPKGYRVHQADALLRWVAQQAAAGLGVALLGGPYEVADATGIPPDLTSTNALLSHFGLRYAGDYTDVPLSWTVARKHAAYVEFERPLNGPLPAFGRYEAVGESGVEMLRLQDIHTSPPATSVVAVAKPGAAFVDSGFVLWQGSVGSTAYSQWHIDPFHFFATAFATTALPKLDPTTASNRRLVFALVDGDGWTNKSDLIQYRQAGASAPQVLRREVLERYPNLTFSVAPIGSDLDPANPGSTRARRDAIEIFALGNVEAAVHTFSHPLHWRSDDPAAGTQYNEVHTRRTPQIAQELDGALALLQQVLPPGKRVRLIQWPGDMAPPGEALAAASRLNLLSINGGSPTPPGPFSYSLVAPFSYRDGQAIQVYAANDNEQESLSRIPSRKAVRLSIAATDIPRRVRPLSIYFHAQSAADTARLNTLRSVLDSVLSEESIVAWPSDYVRAVAGFEQAEITVINQDSWQISQRGALQTVRFDDAGSRSVDLTRSRGVLGERHVQDALYVALDAAVPDAIVALRGRQPAESQSSVEPLLLQASWHIAALRREAGSLRFTAAGFGPGHWQWHTPPRALYLFRALRGGALLWEDQTQASASGVLNFTVPVAAQQPVMIVMRRLADRTAEQRR